MTNKLIYSFGLVIATVVLMAGCEKGPQFRQFNYPEPTISGMTPGSGYAGIDVTISGKDFGDLANAVKVWFGGVPADTVRSCADNQIVVKVPNGAASGKVSLQVWTHKFDSIATYMVIPTPTYKSISANRGNPDDVITISGSNFGDDASTVKVMIGSTAAEIVSVSDDKIQFKVPNSSSGALVLSFGAFQVTGPFFFIGDEKITGRLIGHSGSWGNNPATTIAAAVDSNLSTYVDAPTKTGYVGYDVGAGKGARVTLVRYAPRASNPARMVGGEIRGANDPTLFDYVTLHKITQQPPTGTYTEVPVSTDSTYRYIYYYSPDGNCNIAEIEFYGQVEDKPLPQGKYVYEFDEDGNNEGWMPQQGGTWTVNNGALNVNFTQTTGKKRSDLAIIVGGNGTPVTVNTGTYPIMAIKFNKPATCNVTFDTNLGSFGNGSNKYSTDLAGKDVYYWDMSALTLGSSGVHPNEQITFDKTCQFKIADVPDTDPATGYSVQWIRTFENKQALIDFANR